MGPTRKQQLWTFENSKNPIGIKQHFDVPTTLRLLTPPMETPDPPNDTPGALKQVVLTPHDIPWSLRVVEFHRSISNGEPLMGRMKKLGSPRVVQNEKHPTISEKSMALSSLWKCFLGTCFLFTNLNYAIAHPPPHPPIYDLVIAWLNSHCFPMVRDSHTPIDKGLYTKLQDSYSY